MSGTYYYFGTDGYVKKNKQTINGQPYQFSSTTGAAYKAGWINYANGNRAYCLGNGKLATGTVTIDGSVYTFGSDGYLDEAAKHAITGKVSTNAATLAKLYKSKVGSYYENTYVKLTKTDVDTIEEFCQIYVEEAAAENINVEVAFCQAMHETGWLKYGGDVKATQFNFAGLGATGGGAGGATFKDVRTGVRAQIQHLKAYANKEPLKNACVDPRFDLVTRGSAPYVEWLGQKENPTGAGWATSAEYGYNIIAIMNQL